MKSARGGVVQAGGECARRASQLEKFAQSRAAAAPVYQQPQSTASPPQPMQDILASELSRLKADAGVGRKIWRKTVTAPAVGGAAPDPLGGAAPAPPPPAAPAAAPEPAPPAAPPLRSALRPSPQPPPLDAATAALRAAGQPVRLFGESEAQRCARAGLPLPEGSGSRKRARQEEEGEGAGCAAAAEAAAAAPAAADGHAAADEGGAAGVRFAEPPAPSPPSAPAEPAPPPQPPAAAPPREQRARSHLDALPFAPGQPASDAHRYLYKFWHGLLCEWEGALGARAPAQAGSALGRAEAASAAQTRDFLAPFFRLCQGRAVPSDLLPLCLEVVGHLLAREYMAAGDAYLRLAVGKAQWLMGVSQVGLHERAARERIYIGKLPHVMNDETQRRYLTAMKKLMTVLQDMRPPEDASKRYAP